MSVYEKLMQVQSELKAPKNQYNSFGKYNYRSCEDILEGVKPLLKKVKATLTISDEIVQVADRIYVKAIATFTDIEEGSTITNSAYAREATDKKGMDESQVTGATSSYARKYCLNGLLCIDDTKDADTDENKNEKTARAEKAKKEEKTTKVKQDSPEEAKLNDEMRANVNPDLLPDPERTPEYRAKRIKKEIERTGLDETKLLENAKVDEWVKITDAKYVSLLEWLMKKPDKESK